MGSRLLCLAVALSASVLLLGACGGGDESQPAKPDKTVHGYGAEAKSEDGPAKLNPSRLPEGVARLLQDDANDVTGYECVKTMPAPSRGERSGRCKARIAGETRSFIYRKNGWIEVTDKSSASGQTNSAPERVRLEPCRVDGGGYNVMIANVRCKEVGNTIGHWGPRQVFAKGDRREGIFLEDGWQCWARLEQKHGPILNVCMRGDAVITFKFA